MNTKAYNAGRATRSAALAARKTTVATAKAVKTTVADFFRGLRGDALVQRKAR